MINCNSCTEINQAFDDPEFRKMHGLSPLCEKRIVNEILAGKWGNGRERKHRLEAAGYNYRYVQDRVNERLGIHKNSDALPLSPIEKTENFSQVLRLRESRRIV